MEKVKVFSLKKYIRDCMKWNVQKLIIMSNINIWALDFDGMTEEEMNAVFMTSDDRWLIDKCDWTKTSCEDIKKTLADYKYW